MFGRWRFRDDRPAFAWGGGYQPGSEEPWQPWAQPERPPFGPPWARHGRFPFSPPWAGHGRPPFGPPWAGHEQPPFGPPFGGGIWRMARHFPFGPGGRGQMRERFMGRGDLKYVLLALLRERPKHGYEMMKELEDQASGFYTPSAGAVYPTLQLMEDRGWVTNQTIDGKKVYTITDTGRQELEAQQQRAQTFGGPFGWGGQQRGQGGPFGRQAMPELHALRREGMEVARLLMASVRASGGDPEKLARLRGIIEGTRDNLQEFLGQTPAGTGGPATTPLDDPIE